MSAREPSETETGTLSGAELRRLAVSGVMSVAARGVVIRVVGLIGNLVLARLLTPRDFGVVAFGYTLVTFGAFLSDGGIGAALIRRRAEPSARELRSLLGFVLSTSVLTTAVVAAIGVPLGRTGLLAAVMALSLPIGAFKVPTAVVSERRLFYRPLVRADITEVAVYNVSAIGLVVAGLGVWGLAVAAILSVWAGTTTLVAMGHVGFIAPTFSLGDCQTTLELRSCIPSRERREHVARPGAQPRHCRRRWPVCPGDLEHGQPHLARHHARPRVAVACLVPGSIAPHRDR